MRRVVLLRHGQSEWNSENRFTGWTDVGLTEQGVFEAMRSGRQLLEAGFQLDCVFTSMLVRAIRTTWLVLGEMKQEWVPVINDWRLNERHYGALQGLNKTETADHLGGQQVYAWRRSYKVRPPLMGWDDPDHPRFDRRYAGIDPQHLPVGESLQDTGERVLACWREAILPRVMNGEEVLISAHGNSLRALVKELDGLDEHEIMDLNIPTGIPLVYEFDGTGRVTGSRYMADESTVLAATEAVRRELERIKHRRK